jgi:hypothetical protein
MGQRAESIGHGEAEVGKRGSSEATKLKAQSGKDRKLEDKKVGTKD